MKVSVMYFSVGDKYRDMSFSQLLDLSHPYAEISCDGRVCVAKAEGSGGVLNFNTCAQQLLYEIGDPSAYITPDVVSLCAYSSIKKQNRKMVNE